MTTKFIEYPDRESWLAARKNTLGASEVAAAIGVSPWMSRTELWRIKTGRKKPKDISAEPRVIFGQNAEGLLRDLFMLEHPEYEIEYHPFRVYFQEETPFLTATLDGELTRKEDNAKGVYEGKTAECSKKAQWEKWRGRVPDNYYVQLCHQLWCVGKERSFSVLNAKIRGRDGNSALFNYEYFREDMEQDIAFVISEAKKFWYYVEKDEQPPERLG